MKDFATVSLKEWHVKCILQILDNCEATQRTAWAVKWDSVVRQAEEVLSSGLVHMHAVQTGTFTHHSQLNSQNRPLATQLRGSTEGNGRAVTQLKMMYVSAKLLYHPHWALLIFTSIYLPCNTINQHNDVSCQQLSAVWQLLSSSYQFKHEKIYIL